MKQIMSNLRLQIIQLSMSQYILTHLIVVNISWTILMPRANERAQKTQGTGIIRKCVRT